MTTRFRYAAVGLVLVGGAAQADGLDPVKGAFGETKYILDTRLRMEEVDQDPLAEDAEAVTLRARLGFETGKAWNTTLLAESDALWPLDGDYNSTVNGKTLFPV